MIKVLAFDTETTGLQCPPHQIIQLAAVYYEDFQEVDSINILMRPTLPEHQISPEALDIQHRSLEDLRGYDSYDAGYRRFHEFLDKHVDKYNPGDKMYPMAYNGHFDMSFLNALFFAHEDKYLGSYINKFLIDPLALVRVLHMVGRTPFSWLTSCKLSEVCNLFSVPLVAHDALNDIRGMFSVFLETCRYLSDPYLNLWHSINKDQYPPVSEQAPPWDGSHSTEAVG